MTNHHDELRVDPDRSQAEELRRLLHDRLANGSFAEPVVPILAASMSVRSTDAEDLDDRVREIIGLETDRRVSNRWPAAVACPTGCSSSRPLPW